MKVSLPLVRFSVLWIWIITIFFSISIYLFKGANVKMDVDEVISNLSSILSVIIPQVTIIFSFVFKDAGNHQKEQIERNQQLALFALIISLIYHSSFWFLLWYGIINEKLGDTMNANTNAILHIIGFISILGLSPVGFLFSTNTDKVNHQDK